jgi:hypothetical protein
MLLKVRKTVNKKAAARLSTSSTVIAKTQD